MRARYLLLLIFLLSATVVSRAQNDDELTLILQVAGVNSIEEISHDQVESFEHLLQHPININDANGPELSSCGLFSSFQVASLVDYRSRHGCVMSMTELSVLDGFNKEFVAIISPFISIEGKSLSELGGASKNRVRGEVAFRGGYKTELEENINHFSMGAMKLRTSFTSHFTLSVSLSKAYDLERFKYTCLGGNLTWNHKYGKVVVGDYNLRIGQGLSVWNSMVVASRTSPSSMMRKPTGLSASYSFTGSSVMTGLAADLNINKWRLTCGVYVPKVKSVDLRSDRLVVAPVLNLQRIGKIGHVSMTHNMSFSTFPGTAAFIPQMKTAVDFAICVRGVNMYGEAAYDWVETRPGLLLGSDFQISDPLRMAAMLRYLPTSEEHGATVAGEFFVGRHKGTFSIDALYHPSEEKYPSGRGQLKVLSDWNWKINDFLDLKLRASERLRTWGDNFRTELRTDMSYVTDHLLLMIRVNALKCKSLSTLTYIEAGYRSKVLSAYLREGFFIVDNWEDRIYVYERDAPGSFNVPAMYGRGLWTSMYVTLKMGRWGSLYCRMSYMSYPFMKKNKPGKAELKLMMNVKF